MAKVTFSKLGIKKIEETTKTVTFNDIEIAVKQYLPIEEKLKMLSTIINKANDSSKFYNPAQLSVFFLLEVIFNYTDITFTDKQKEDFTKLYDLIITSGLSTAIVEAIPPCELDKLWQWLDDSVRAIYDFNSSALGVLSSLKTDYNNLDMDIEGLQNKIKDPENLALLKEIAPLLDLA